jgi:hypothetical protein
MDRPVRIHRDRMRSLELPFVVAVSTIAGEGAAVGESSLLLGCQWRKRTLTPTLSRRAGEGAMAASWEKEPIPQG